MTHSEPNILLSFILLLVIASLTSYYAIRKGRNPIVWFVLGLLLGIFAPLILLFLSKVKPEGNGLPTMTVSQPDPSLAHLPHPPPSPEEVTRLQEENKLWYYLDQDHQQIGPVSVVGLRELWNRGKLDLNQYVWSEGMEKWEKVDNLPELKSVLNKPVL